MIKFFRRIRYNLMGTGKKGKYLKYAIGEIVLVMIGILLALQVNIWNEERKVDNDIDQMFSLLESELDNNILSTSGLLRIGYLTDSIRTLFREKKVTREMLREKPYLTFGDYRTRSTFLEEERLNEIIAQEKKLSQDYIALIPDIKRLKRRIKAWRFWQSKALELSMQRNKELADETPWFANGDSLAFENIITRSLNDKIYRSKVEHYNDYQLDENIWEANLIRTSSVALLWELKSANDKNLKIEEFLKNLNLKPLIEYACNEIPKKAFEVYFTRSIIIFNNRSEDVTLRWRSKNNDDYSLFTIPAKTFSLNRIYMYASNYIELEENGKCSKVFDSYNEDYIIL